MLSQQFTSAPLDKIQVSVKSWQTRLKLPERTLISTKVLETKMADLSAFLPSTTAYPSSKLIKLMEGIDLVYAKALAGMSEVHLRNFTVHLNIYKSIHNRLNPKRQILKDVDLRPTDEPPSSCAAAGALLSAIQSLLKQKHKIWLMNAIARYFTGKR